MTDLKSLSRVGMLLVLGSIISFVPFASSIYGPISMLFAFWMLPRRYFALYVGVLAAVEAKDFILPGALAGTAWNMALKLSTDMVAHPLPVAPSPLTPIFIGWRLMPFPFNVICPNLFILCFLYLYYRFTVVMLKWSYRRTRTLYEDVMRRVP